MNLSLEELEILKSVPNFDSQLTNIIAGLGSESIIVESENLNKAKNTLAEYVDIVRISATPQSNIGMVDMRIKSAFVKNFRKFPDNQYQYGFGFGDTSSIIVIGNNGTGKSSLYDAIELTYTGRISESLYRDIEDNRRFSLHNENDEATISIQTSIGDGIKDMARRYAFMPTFFCSEGDLKKRIEAMPFNAEESWTDYFSTFLNVEHLKKLTNTLQTVHDCIKTGDAFGNITDIDSEITTIEQERMSIGVLKQSKNYKTNIIKTITDIQNRIEEIGTLVFIPDDVARSIENIKATVRLSKATKNFLKSIGLETDGKVNSILVEIDKNGYAGQANTKLTGKLLNSTEVQSFDIEVYNKYLERIRKEFILALETVEEIADDNFFDNVIEKIGTRLSLLKYKKKATVGWVENNLQLSISNFKEGIETALHHYICNLVTKDRLELIRKALTQGGFLSGNEELAYNVVDNNIFVNMEYTEKSQIISMSPKKYFNTFRLKLFTLCVQTVMAITLMKEKDIRVPIVFDDVFYASDFENRRKLKFFFTWMNDTYNSIMSKEKTAPLQLIFFTHDEQIFSVCRDTIDKTSVRFGRLFDYEIMEKRADQDGKVNLLVEIK